MKTTETIFETINTQLRGFEYINFTDNKDEEFARNYRPKGTASIEDGEIIIKVQTYFNPTIFERYSTRSRELETYLNNIISFHINRPVVLRWSSGNFDGWSTFNFVVDQTSTINPEIADANKFTISAKKWKDNNFNSFYSLVINFVLNLKKYPEMFAQLNIKLIDNVVTYDGTFVLKVNVLNHYASTDGHKNTYDYHMFIGKTICGSLNTKVHSYVTNYFTTIYEKLNKNSELRFVHTEDTDISLTSEHRFWYLKIGTTYTRFQPDWKNQDVPCTRRPTNNVSAHQNILNVGDIVTLPDGKSSKITDVQPSGISIENVGWCGRFTNTFKFVAEQVNNKINDNIDKFLAFKSLLEDTYIQTYLLNGSYDKNDHTHYTKIHYVETFKRLRMECINIVIPKEHLEKFLDVSFNPKCLTEIAGFLQTVLEPLNLDPLVQSIICDCFYSIRREKK